MGGGQQLIVAAHAQCPPEQHNEPHTGQVHAAPPENELPMRICGAHDCEWFDRREVSACQHGTRGSLGPGVEELAADWEQAGKSQADLPQGTLLRHYINQKERLIQAGTSRAQAFIATAMAAGHRRRTQRHWLRALVAIAVLAIAASAGLAWRARARALASAQQAADARDRSNEHLSQVLSSVEQVAAIFTMAPSSLRSLMVQTAVFPRIRFFSMIKPLPYRSESSANEMLLPFFWYSFWQFPALLAQAPSISAA